jgi:plastocyanin
MTRLLSMRPTPLVLLFIAVVLGCGGDGGNGGTPPPTTTIAKAPSNSGDAQSGSVGQPLAAPLRVVVTEDGAASSGRTVTWSTTVAGASLNPASAVTDASGIASSAWTLGGTSGSQSAQATLTGATGSPVTFTATAAAGAAASLSKLSGDNQSGQTGAQLAAPVQAKVSDPFGNGVEGVSVAWAATGGTVSAATVPSDAAGASAVNVTLGGTAGPIVITATAGDLAGSPLTFNATATAGPPPGTTVQVLNNSFSPVSVTITAPATVTWNWPSGSAGHNVVPDDGSTPASSGALANGPKTYSFTFNTPGTYRYYCANHGSPGGVGMSGTITVQ